MAMTQIEIDRQLRERIIDAVYPPGSRLPTRLELESEFGVSSNTIQRAVNRLVADGFAVARGRAGTFASDNPPHLSRIVLLFPGDFEDCIAHSHFFKALSNETRTVSERLNVSFEIVDNFNNWRSMAKMRELVDDTLERRYAGVIFASVPFPLAGSPILEEAKIARVAMMSKPRFGMPAVWHDDRGVYSKALAHAKARGCQRPAFLIPEGIFAAVAPDVLEQAAELGLEVEPAALQQISIGYRESIPNLLELLFRHRPPDALMVGDDSILRLVSEKLQGMGMTTSS
jgi:GntR family transcriptional regulator/MocR family aminotransferase